MDAGTRKNFWQGNSLYYHLCKACEYTSFANLIEVRRCESYIVHLLENGAGWFASMQAGYPVLSSGAYSFFKRSAYACFSLTPCVFFRHEEAEYYLSHLCLLTGRRIARNHRHSQFLRQTGNQLQLSQQLVKEFFHTLASLLLRVGLKVAK